MKTSGNTILIIGGSAGIGIEMAKLFLAAGNKVIITGRDTNRLDEAVKKLPGVKGIKSDFSDGEQAVVLARQVTTEYPDLNIVINNAARAVLYQVGEDYNSYEYAKDEFNTNFLSVLRLNDLLLPALKKQPVAAIVNVTSVVAFAATTKLATYGASKAALHSYSQTLRLGLKDTSVRVFELMPPLINTEFSKEIGGEKGIAPELVAQHLVDGLASDTYEIHSGQTADFYKLFHASPDEAFKAMNGPR